MIGGTYGQHEEWHRVSIRKLASELDRPKRTVEDALKRLLERGTLEQQKSGSSGAYRINLNYGNGAAPVTFHRDTSEGVGVSRPDVTKVSRDNGHQNADFCVRDDANGTPKKEEVIKGPIQEGTFMDAAPQSSFPVRGVLQDPKLSKSLPAPDQPDPAHVKLSQVGKNFSHELEAAITLLEQTNFTKARPDTTQDAPARVSPDWLKSAKPGVQELHANWLRGDYTDVPLKLRGRRYGDLGAVLATYFQKDLTRRVFRGELADLEEIAGAVVGDDLARAA